MIKLSFKDAPASFAGAFVFSLDYISFFVAKIGF